MEELLKQLNWVDYIILGSILLSILLGLFRGVVREIFSLLSWIISVSLAVVLDCKTQTNHI